MRYEGASSCLQPYRNASVLLSALVDRQLFESKRRTDERSLAGITSRQRTAAATVSAISRNYKDDWDGGENAISHKTEQ
ncbi:hypothetical protein H6P81_016540 [Aristolochia fimbriata]|uniref:Uncharacterized protein n=1 Tax=Aristolochia fimbriata TaxID=158543 RepID=A0AAV7E8J7_ARIFI|nr:hypothetical protein H6P81_016540 [Aristolochia fimbriata]